MIYKSIYYEKNRDKILKNYHEHKFDNNWKPFSHPLRNCKRCQKEFTANTQNQIFCSKSCNITYYKEKYEENLRNGFEKNLIYPYLRMRFEILKRDGFQCQYCGRSPKIDGCKLVIDHIIPRAKGGLNEIFNLITSCQECNLGKSDVLIEERKLIKFDINYGK